MVGRGLRPFLLSLVALAAVIVGVGGLKLIDGRSSSRTLRVAFPVARDPLTYEPTEISVGHEYIFLENIFSTLVEIDNHGSVQPGLAEKIDWVGPDLHIRLRPDLRTASGQPITIDDVVFSVKRLLVKAAGNAGANTHGNLRELLCRHGDLKSVDDTCEGIHAEGRELILALGGYKPFFIPMLATIDFAIIPRSSCDPKTLALINLKETSGPYFVESSDQTGRIILALNRNHVHASRDIAERIVLVPMPKGEPKRGIEALAAGDIDMLTTVDQAKADQIIPFAQAHSDFDLHSTLKIRASILVFTDRGRRRFTLRERRFVAAATRAAFRQIYADSAGFQPRDEFFPVGAEGGLTESDRAILKDGARDAADHLHTPIRIGLMNRGLFSTWEEPLSKALPTAVFRLQNNPPELEKTPPGEEMPDAFICSTDTSFQEDIGLISYSVNAGFLGLEKEKRKGWIASYVSMSDKRERTERLRELHFQALHDVTLVPLVASPYTAIVRKPWRLELSNLFANNQLWQIRLR